MTTKETLLTSDPDVKIIAPPEVKALNKLADELAEISKLEFEDRVNTHACCTSCWFNHFGNRFPYRLNAIFGIIQETCCFCESTTTSGIYFSMARELVPCEGMGGVHFDPADSD